MSTTSDASEVVLLVVFTIELSCSVCIGCADLSLDDAVRCCWSRGCRLSMSSCPGRNTNTSPGSCSSSIYKHSFKHSITAATIIKCTAYSDAIATPLRIVAEPSTYMARRKYTSWGSRITTIPGLPEYMPAWWRRCSPLPPSYTILSLETIAQECELRSSSAQHIHTILWKGRHARCRLRIYIHMYVLYVCTYVRSLNSILASFWVDGSIGMQVCKYVCMLEVCMNVCLPWSSWRVCRLAMWQTWPPLEARYSSLVAGGADPSGCQFEVTCASNAQYYELCCLQKLM